MQLNLFGRPLAFSTLVASLTLLVATASPAQQATPPVLGPPGDAFYIPPSPLPPGEAGDLIWYRPTQLYLDPGRLLPFNANAWKVLYRSTSLSRQPVAVSGTVIVSRRPAAGTRPLLSYAVGTHGMGDQCAPSKLMPAGTDPEALLIKPAVDQGWAVAVSDYMGLGTPGNHPYVVRELAGRAVLDIARAASRIPQSGISAAAPVGVMGYSEGGNAAASAAEIASDYAPDLRLVGVAAGGVPADLLRVAENIDGGPFFGFLGFAAIGLDTAYDDLQLASFLNATGKSLLAQANEDCTVEKYAFFSISDITTSNPLETKPWQRRIEEVRLGKVAPKVPMHLYHSVLDEVIPFDVGWNLRSDYCALGVPVSWRSFLLSGHVTGAIFGAPGAMIWLRNRFAGRTAPNDC